MKHILILAFVLACGQDLRALADPPSDQISQVSVINALMLGQYDGTMPLEEVLQLGNFGLGTVDHLDGELIILDGQAYQARGDGSVHRCDSKMTTPFAVITPFEGEERFSSPPIASLEQLEMLLDAKLPSRDVFAAIRIEAEFDSVSLRTVSRQEPPYRPLSEVVKTQSQWERKHLRGTLLGIRCPKWVTGIGIPGYHWHFLSEDRKAGGHVFNCQFQNAEIAFDRCGNWLIKLGTALDKQGQDLSQDLSKEIDQVERQRKPAAATGK